MHDAMDRPDDIGIIRWQLRWLAEQSWRSAHLHRRHMWGIRGCSSLRSLRLSSRLRLRLLFISRVRCADRKRLAHKDLHEREVVFVFVPKPRYELKCMLTREILHAASSQHGRIYNHGIWLACQILCLRPQYRHDILPLKHDKALEDPFQAGAIQPSLLARLMLLCNATQGNIELLFEDLVQEPILQDDTRGSTSVQVVMYIVNRRGVGLEVR